MSKTFLRRLFMLALCACLVLLAVLPAGADFGDYSGDSDYGSSSDWSSSDSDWDWSSSDSDYSSSSESSGGISTIVVGSHHRLHCDRFDLTHKEEEGSVRRHQLVCGCKPQAEAHD